MKKIYGLLLGMAFILERLEQYNLRQIAESYSPKISDLKVKQNLRNNKTFYQEPIIDFDKRYFNKGISKDGKKTRGKYIAIQSRARDRREKIRKTLEKKI
jgi:hypothetical protein